METALALFGFFVLPASVLLWQQGRTERQRLAIEWAREKYKATQHAEAKRWEDAVAASETRLAKLEADVKRIQENRVVLKGVGT